MLCGVTPLVSSEIYHKYQNLKDYIVEINPLDKNSFTKTLERAINDDKMNMKIVNEYKTIRNIIGDYDNYVKQMENIFLEFCK